MGGRPAAMSIVNQITANTFAIRELEAAIGELKERCIRRDRENAELLAELESTSEQLYNMWQIVSDPTTIIDTTVVEAFRADLSRRHSTDMVNHCSLENGNARSPLMAADVRPHATPERLQALDLARQSSVEGRADLLSLQATAGPSPTAVEATQTDGACITVRLTPPVDFTGTWALAQSINFKEYLEATGVSWAKRQVAAKLKPVQEWLLAEENVWEFSMNTPIGRRVERIVVNGTVEDEIDGLHVLKESFWDRDELVTLCRPRDPSKAVAHTEFRRRYDKLGDRMVLEIVTGKARCTRIFERQMR